MYQDKQTGFSPLMVAAQHRQVECVKQLLSHPACTQEAVHLVSSVTLRTVYHICAEVKQDEMTKELCQPRYLSSLLVMAPDIQGDTPLHICAQVGNAYMAKLLLDYIENNFSSREVTPHTTTTTAHRSMTNLDVNGLVPSKPSRSKIHTTNQQTRATEYVHRTLMKKNKNKYTPLHVAISYGNLNVIEKMLQYSHPSVINAFDDQMRTSLHMAAEKGETLTVLLSCLCLIKEFYRENV